MAEILIQSYDITSPDLSANMAFAYILIAQTMLNAKRYEKAKFYVNCALNLQHDVFIVGDLLLREIYNRYLRS